MPDFAAMPIAELDELAIQAEIPGIELMSRGELVKEMEDDFYKAWDEAILTGIDLASS
jgi:predicted transcriptional regulator